MGGELMIRGSGSWALNLLRSDALTAFLSDLLDREENGFHPDECKRVDKALRQLSSDLGGIPDGGLLSGSIRESFEKFNKGYLEWNNDDGRPENSVEHRRKAHEKLRRLRHRLSRRVRKSQYIIANDLDLRVVEAQYEALAHLVKDLPKMFANLARALARFAKRK